MPKKQCSKKNLIFSGEDFKFDSAEESRSFRGIAYSGQIIKDHPWWGPQLIFDVESMSYQDRIPILRNHDMDKIVGSGSLKKEKNQLIVNGEFSNVTKDGQETYELVKVEKFPMQESVFILPSEIDELKTGSTVVNGIEVKAPATIFRGGVIKEVSMVPLGADENTSTEMFSFNVTTKNVREKKYMNKNLLKFKEILEDKGEEEAYKFACACEKKEHEEKEEKFSDDIQATKEENAQLKKDLDDANAKIASFESSKETEKKEMKVRRVKDVFKKFGMDPSADAIDVYVSYEDKKFDAALTGLETSLSQGMQQSKTNTLKSVQVINHNPTAPVTDAQKFGIKQEVFDEENKIQAEALKFRAADPKLSVVDAREKARKSLGITG